MVSNYLLIDTSTEYGLVAMTYCDQIAFEASLGHSYDSAQTLIPLLHRQLEENSLTLSCIEAIAVTVGPGSYTGIRLGVITAKALSFALNKPLIGVPSTEVFAPLDQTKGSFAVLIDARMGGVYLSLGTIHQGIATYSPPRLVSLEELPNYLEGVHSIASPHAIKLRERLASLSSAYTWHESFPSARLLMQAASRLWHQGKSSLEGKVDILYLRKTQAELEKQINTLKS